MSTRAIKALHSAVRDDIGDLTTRRPLPGAAIPHLDPFLFLNHHGPQIYPPNNRGLPFGPHPHRGFETVTFILEGELGHYDSGGHSSIIRAGGVQWMTAGCGVVHAELSPPAFKRAGGPMEALQLWLNLPARLKFTKPAYFGLQRDDVPAVPLDGGRAELRLISGDLNGVRGPVPSLIGAFLSFAMLKAGARIRLPAPRGENIFLYVVRGGLTIGGVAAPEWRLVELHEDGDAVEIEAAQDALILYGHAAPFNEPIVAHGPFVMNTREEIVQAIQDYQEGKFGDAPV